MKDDTKVDWLNSVQKRLLDLRRLNASDEIKMSRSRLRQLTIQCEADLETIGNYIVGSP